MNGFSGSSENMGSKWLCQVCGEIQEPPKMTLANHPVFVGLEKREKRIDMCEQCVIEMGDFIGEDIPFVQRRSQITQFLEERKVKIAELKDCNTGQELSRGP